MTETFIAYVIKYNSTLHATSDNMISKIFKYIFRLYIHFLSNNI